MHKSNGSFTLKVKNTEAVCPIGESTGKKMMEENNVPVISCEGSCIRGEIARLAANKLAKKEGFGRGCHGEIISVPHSAMAKWAQNAEKIVVIDGCFLHCHGRVLNGLFGEDQLAIFDALSYYKKYTDIMDIDDVPEDERNETARLVADQVFHAMKNGLATACGEENAENSCGCGAQPSQAACGG